MDKNKIGIIYGMSPKEMVKALLEDAKIENEIEKNALIGLKPNLVIAKKAHSGATTTPEIVEGVIEYLQEKGRNNIVVMEGSWVGEGTNRAFKVCGYDKISKKYNVPLYDLQKDRYSSHKVKDIDMQVCDQVMAVDYLINIPVLKGHCQTNMTCALKNLKGCITNDEKRRFHRLGLHKPIAYLNKIIKQDLIIVDGLNGDLSFEEGGTPIPMNRILLGKDPVLIDAYVCDLMGYVLDDVPYIKISDGIGVGNCDITTAVIKEINKANHNIDVHVDNQKVGRLTENVEADSACSACYGSLVHALKRLQEQGYKIENKIY
ncbi:MAG: DUF362 domain-containing protein, partial [Clostridia bacterium]|nr:DUF362 domain-containing protein [Clostridia bacterium]